MTGNRMESEIVTEKCVWTDEKVILKTEIEKIIIEKRKTGNDNWKIYIKRWISDTEDRNRENCNRKEKERKW